MAETKHKNIGLGNPAMLIAAKTPAGQEVITRAVGNTFEKAERSVNMIGTGLKVVAIGAALYIGYRIWKGRFVSEGINPALEPANITDAQANARANAIYEAMYGFGANKNIVAQQLAGLNYNGWIKVYNAFGNRKGANPFGAEMNLVEWLNDQFNPSQMNDLRLILTGVF